MDCWDADEAGILSSEYEVLFCVRDMLSLYEKQLTGLYGEAPERIRKTKEDIEKRICEIEKKMDSGL